MVTPDHPAENLVGVFEQAGLPVVFVASADGGLVGMVTDHDLLQALLPPYVREDPVLARVLEHDAARVLRCRLEGQPATSLVDLRRQGHPAVGPDDTLVEVTSAIIQSGDPAVAVVAGGRLVGLVAAQDLLPALLGRHRGSDCR